MSKKVTRILLLITLIFASTLLICTKKSYANTETRSVVVGDWTYVYDLESDGNAHNVYVSKYQNGNIPGANVLNLTIPAELDGHSVKSIGNGVKNIIGKTGRENISTSGVHQYWMRLTLPEGLESINDYGLEGISFHGTKFTIPNSVESIGKWSMANCKNECSNTTITIPNSVQTIGDYAFANVFDNSFSYNPEYNSVSESSSGTAKYWWRSYPSMCRELELGSGLKTIGKYAFLNQQRLTSVTIPRNVDSIGEGAFLNTCLGTISIADGRSNLLTIDRYAFALTDVESFTVTKKCLLGDGVFAHCYNLSNVTLEENINKIPDYTFYNCRFLQNITKESDIAEIGKNAFTGCKNISTEKYQNIVQGTTKIGEYAFSGCNGLTGTIIINSCVEELGKYAFSNCENIEVANIEANLTNIPEGTFYMCGNLTDVTKSNTIKEIGEKAFYECTRLNIADDNQTVHGHVLSNITKIGNYAFYGCTGIDGQLSLSNSVANLGKYVFSRCSGITSVVLGYNYEEVPEGAFFECGLLDNVTMPVTVTKLGKKAFSKCLAINMQELNDILTNVQVIGESCFEGCTGIEGELLIKNIVTNVDKKAFYDCTGITRITFEENAGTQNFGEMCFYNVANSQKVFYIHSNGGTNIATRAFKNVGELFLHDSYYNVVTDYRWYGEGTEPIVHYGGCTHNIRISCTLPGVSIVNPENGNKLSTADVACESDFSFKLIIDDEYQDKYPDMKLKIISVGEYESSDPVVEYLSTAHGTEHTIEHVTRDKQIAVVATENGTDLVLRQYISKLNGSAISETRKPNIRVVNKKLSLLDYNHTKYPVSVNKGDKITYTIRVYNEGKDIDGVVNQVKVRIPDGLNFVSNNQANIAYGWSASEDGKEIITSYLSDKAIAKYTSRKPEFVDVEYTLEITGGSLNPTDLVTIAEIVDGNDTDSLNDSISLLENDEYNVLIQDCITQGQNSNRDGYILVDEDDTDFEYVVVSAQVGTEYSLVVSKIDSITEDLLNGAKIQLLDKDKNLIEEGITTNGTVTFNEITSYGEGTDKYYIKEVDTPVGYKKTMNGEILIEVTKTIDDQGNMNVEIVYDTEEMGEEESDSDDHETQEFIPIKTKAQLLQIGSGNSVTVDGQNYLFAEEANYRLLNDIDFNNEPIQPIEHMNGIFDGNGKKIINLKISGENLNVAEVALFRQFSGTIKNLTISQATITGGTTLEGHSAVPSNTQNTKSSTAVLVGIMGDGKIENCSITSGEISSVSLENVGGFVGIARGNVTIKGSTNNATIHASEVPNVGGFIGNAMGSHTIVIDECHNTASVIEGNINVGGIVGYSESVINISNSDNKAQISAVQYNAGGIIGKSEPNGVASSSSVVQYDADSKQIRAYIKSKKVQGEYDLIIHNADLTKEEGNQMLAGAKFSIYDGEGNLLKDKVEVNSNGILAMEDVIINSLTTDVYYIREDEAPKGYEILINGLIEVKVTKTWDRENGKYVINKEVNIIDDLDEIEEILPSGQGVLVGRRLERMQTSNVRYKHTQTGILACYNYAQVTANTSNAGGIAGCLVGYSTIENCSNRIPENNSETIVIGGNSSIAGGIVSELMPQTEKDEANIIDCTNSIPVSGESVGGIAGVSATNTQIINCKNIANITDTSYVGGGILGRAVCNTYIEACTNEGDVIGAATAGGIVGNSGLFDYKIVTKSGELIDMVPTYKESLEIVDCKVNSCKVTAGTYNAGGIIGSAGSTNNIITDNTVEDVLVCAYSNNCCSGGVVGICEGMNIDVDGCNVIKAQICPNGCPTNIVGGIIAQVQKRLGNGEQKTIVNECNVYGTVLGYNGGSPVDIGGIIGIVVTGENLVISNCNVGNYEDIRTTIRTTSGDMGNVGGIVAYIQTQKNITIENCNVDNLKMELYANNMQFNMGGIISMIYHGENVNISNCSITNNEFYTRSSANQNACNGGVIGYVDDVDHTNIDSCRAENNSFDIMYSDVGGVIGHYRSGETLDINNCSINNINIQQTGNIGNSIANTGGVVGSTCVDTTITGCEVTRINVANGGENVGGFVGWAGDNYKTVTIKDSKLNGDYNQNTKENIFMASKTSSNLGTSSIGGAIGLVNGRAIMDNVECYSIRIGESDESTPTTLKAGGLIGQSVGRISPQINNSKVKGLDISIPNDLIYGYNRPEVGGCIGLANYKVGANDVELQDINLQSNVASIGGFIGQGGAIVNNIIVNNMTIEAGKNADVVSGFIAYNEEGVDLSNVELNNVGIALRNMQYSNSVDSSSVAGIIGEDTYAHGNNVDSADILNNITLNGVTLTVTENETENETESKAHVGGIVGFSNASKELDKINISGLTIDSNSTNGIVGGIIALAVPGKVATITNSSITNITATGKYAVGGIIGCGNVKIDNCTVTNPIINANSERGIAGSVAGIALEGSELSYISVTAEGEGNYGVLSNGLAGGIVAINSGALKESSVSNITVETTMEGEPASADAIQVQYLDMYVNCTYENVNVIA